MDFCYLNPLVSSKTFACGIKVYNNKTSHVSLFTSSVDDDDDDGAHGWLCVCVCVSVIDYSMSVSVFDGSLHTLYFVIHINL